MLKQLLYKHEALYKETLATYPVKYKKDYEELGQLRWKAIKSIIENAEIYTSFFHQTYLDNLVKEIVNANPILKDQKFNCYFSRSGVPNAAYLGQGLIVFNIGLFRKLENESQAAFVLCHEIAHFFLKHSENKLHEYISALNSTEVQKELQQIKGATFRKRDRLEQLLKELTFDSRRHSRDHELEADSMAVELLKATRFDVAEALSTLKLLDTIDADTLHMNSALQSLFNANAYPFKKRWLVKEEGLLGGHAKIKENVVLADSLKTHPDCSKRMSLLVPGISQFSSRSGQKNVIDETTFLKLRRQFAYEEVVYAFEMKNYTKSLYYAICHLQNEPDDPYMVTQVGKVLNGFYGSQKNHELSKYIDLPSPSFPSSYNQLLQFVQNLYIEDFGAIAFYYLQPFYSRLHSHPLFAEVYQKSQEIYQQ